MSAFSSLFGSERLVGVDLGGTNLSIVQAEAHRDRIRIVHAVHQATPEGAIKDGIVLDRDAVAGAIRTMLRNSGISATGAVIAVAGPTVTVRKVRLPRMPEAALRKSARYEAGKLISSSVEDSALAVDILGAAADDPSQMDVMLVAAPREMVDSRVDTVERAGLEVISVDLESFALQRAVVECRRSMWDDGRLRALVDLAASHTEVILLHGATFALTRSLPIAGDSITEVLRGYLGCDTETAEARKREVNLQALIDGGSDEEIALARAVQGTIDELLRELRRSINYYQSQTPDAAEEPLAEIVLAGGSAMLTGIAPYMQARLTTPTRVANVLSSSLFAGENDSVLSTWDAPRLGTSLGLALKEIALGPLTSKA